MEHSPDQLDKPLEGQLGPMHRRFRMRRLSSVDESCHSDTHERFEWVCATCEDILGWIEDFDAPRGVTLTNSGQTDQVFLNAVFLKGCFLCSLVHHLFQVDCARPNREPIEEYAPIRYSYRRQRMNSPDDVDENYPRFLSATPSLPRPHNCVSISFVKAPENCIVVPHEDLSSSTGSQSTLETARGWLTSCLAHHDTCNRQRLADDWRHPTRLLDLGEPESSTWKLCFAPDNDSTVFSYMTLSCRWAPNPRIILTRDSLATFQQGLPIDCLPTLFQQVISVVRNFGLRYLWIDALCIVQDWVEDWEREASLMHKVYANSLCNIAALAANGPDDSLFRGRADLEIRGLLQTSLFSRDKLKAPYFVSDQYYYLNQMSGSLNERGWVLQERFLAPRVLYFGKYQVLWECRMETKNEVLPNGQLGVSPVQTIEHLWNFVGPRPAAGTASISDDLLASWIKVVHKFTSGELTYATDRLFAIAGIAQVFAEASGDLYVAGMWKTRMVDMLDWRIHDGPPVRRSLAIAPSFSWASVEGPIGFVHQPSCQVLLENPEVTIPDDGQLAFLTLRGRMCQITRNPQKPREYSLAPLSDTGSGITSATTSLTAKYIFFDHNSKGPLPVQIIICLSAWRTANFLTSIALTRVGQDDVRPVYRRVGSAAFECDESQLQQVLAVEPTEVKWV